MATIFLLAVLTFAVDSSSFNGTPPAPRASGFSPAGGGEGFDFEFSGVFTWGEVISSLCRDGWCRTQLPREFYELSVPLNVYEKDFNAAFKALSMQAKADGYTLRKTGSKKPYTVVADLDKESMSSYISCIDTTVRSVASLDLAKYRLADSMKCFSRRKHLDSLSNIRDTLLYPSSRYRISFYVVSSSFLRTLGVDWTSLWASGDLVSMPKFISDWALRAVAANDTTAEFRTIEVDLDSSTTLHWGSQKKEEKSTVVYSNGVAQNDYEWRDYGLTLNLTYSRLGGISADYKLAQRDENNSVLTGRFGGGGSDSINAFGVYDSYQNIVTGIPWLSRIPIIGYLFGSEVKDKVKSFFVIEVVKVKSNIVRDFPSLDSLRTEVIRQYERTPQDTTDSQHDTLDIHQEPEDIDDDVLRVQDTPGEVYEQEGQ